MEGPVLRELVNMMIDTWNHHIGFGEIKVGHTRGKGGGGGRMKVYLIGGFKEKIIQIRIFLNLD